MQGRLPTLAGGERMSFSAGIASVVLPEPAVLRTFDDRSRFVVSVIESADGALRRSKESGGGRTTVHREDHPSG